MPNHSLQTLFLVNAEISKLLIKRIFLSWLKQKNKKRISKKVAQKSNNETIWKDTWQKINAQNNFLKFAICKKQNG